MEECNNTPCPPATTEGNWKEDEERPIWSGGYGEDRQPKPSGVTGSTVASILGVLLLFVLVAILIFVAKRKGFKPRSLGGIKVSGISDRVAARGRAASISMNALMGKQNPVGDGWAVPTDQFRSEVRNGNQPKKGEYRALVALDISRHVSKLSKSFGERYNDPDPVGMNR